jgi:hypothetical protein
MDGQHEAVGRSLRLQAGGLVYHVLNRANRRAPLFQEPGDYKPFRPVLAGARHEHPMRLLAYCVGDKDVRNLFRHEKGLLTPVPPASLFGSTCTQRGT